MKNIILIPRENISPMILNIDHVTRIIGSAGGGSNIYFDQIISYDNHKTEELLYTHTSMSPEEIFALINE